jgi:hypothetical protein
VSGASWSLNQVPETSLFTDHRHAVTSDQPPLLKHALTAALAPFDMNDYRREPFDPDACWDWWQLPEHSGWPLKAEHMNDSRALRVALPGEDPVVAVAPKEIVDFDAIRRAAREHAAGTWDAWAEVIAANPGALPRTHFAELYDDPGEAQQAYLLQPAVQVVAQAAAAQQHRYFTFTLLLADPVALFGGERDSYLAQAVGESVATHAYITLDGQWLSPYTGDRGWEAHVQAMAKYLDSLPPNIMITRIYCRS